MGIEKQRIDMMVLYQLYLELKKSVNFQLVIEWLYWKVTIPAYSAFMIDLELLYRFWAQIQESAWPLFFEVSAKDLYVQLLVTS